jgi:hypothetical protein
MLWFNEYKRNWRVFFLVMLAVAMFGPWFFDRIFVPQPNICSLPNVRLDDDFCGIPISITWLLSGVPSEFVYLLKGLITGVYQPYTISSWFFILLSISLVLPFFSTLVLVIWENWNRTVIFHHIALGLATAAGLWVGIPDLSIRSWMLWGVWLYIILTGGLFAVEILAASKNN